MCGGIVGKLNTNAKVAKCMNRGRVVGYRTVGGVVGQSGGDDTEIESCCNDYDVVGEYLVGGIAGQVQETNISNCLNRGYVESASSSSVHGVGGIVGSVRYGYINHNVNSTTEILDLYDNQNVGAICGYVISLEEMKNNYCLYKQGLSVVGKYNDTSGAISSNNRLTESEMKSSSLISTLNSNMSSGWSKWKIGADGFPALSWMD
jgi:hypothetical protein